MSGRKQEAGSGRVPVRLQVSGHVDAASAFVHGGGESSESAFAPVADGTTELASFPSPLNGKRVSVVRHVAGRLLPLHPGRLPRAAG